MMNLIDHHLAVADPFGVGHSADLAAMMMPSADGGRAFPWLGGGVALRRRAMYPDLHEWLWCGIARGADVTIKQFPGMTHRVNQAYQYAAVDFLANGFVSRISEPIRLDFDGAGALIQPLLPMFPINLAATAIGGGKFIITFEYDPFGQGAAPKDFQVFEGATPATVNYAAPLTDSITGLATIAYNGARVYEFTTGAFSDGTGHVFAIRGRNSSGVAEQNVYTTASITARASSPIAVPAPIGASIRAWTRRGE
jgi:hypothetical protein